MYADQHTPKLQKQLSNEQKQAKNKRFVDIIKKIK
jgi:hypothetical protein